MAQPVVHPPWISVKNHQAVFCFLGFSVETPFIHRIRGDERWRALEVHSAPPGRDCVNSPRYQGEAVVRGSRNFTAFGSGHQHLCPERRAVHSDFPDGDDQLTVQSHQRVELLNHLRREE